MGPKSILVIKPNISHVIKQKKIGNSYVCQSPNSDFNDLYTMYIDFNIRA